MSQEINEQQVHSGTIYDVENKNRDEYIRREQAGENRRFDNIATLHREQISSLKQRLDDMEPRLRKLEKFKYVLLGVGFALGFFIQLLYIMIKK